MFRLARVAFFIFLTVGLLSFAFFFRIKDEMVDFEVNYTAACRLRLGETLYRTSDGHYQFKYMPFSAFLYLPLSMLSLDLAKGIWYAIVLVATFFIFYLAFKLLFRHEKKKLWVVFLSPLILARYFLREIQLGQINALITFLLLGTIWFLCSSTGGQRKEAKAGILAGLAAALKPYALIFWPYFFLRKKWSALAGAGLVFAFALAAPSLFYGFKGNWLVLKEWMSSLSSSTPALFSTQDNVSLIGFLVKWTQRPGLSLVLYAFALILLGGLSLFLISRGKRVSQPELLEGSLLLALIPLLSPLGWDYTFLSSAPAVALILYFFDRFTKFSRILLGLNFVLIGLTLYDLMGRHAYATFMSWSVTTLCFLIVIAYLYILRIRAIV